MTTNDLTKLGLSAGVGYLAASFLVPKRGFALDNPNLPKGQDLTVDQILHPGPWPTNLPPHEGEAIHQNLIPSKEGVSEAGKNIGDAWKSTQDAFWSSLDWLRKNVGMPLLLVGGAVLLVLLTGR